MQGSVTCLRTLFHLCILIACKLPTLLPKIRIDFFFGTFFLQVTLISITAHFRHISVALIMKPDIIRSACWKLSAVND